VKKQRNTYQIPTEPINDRFTYKGYIIWCERLIKARWNPGIRALWLKTQRVVVNYIPTSTEGGYPAPRASLRINPNSALLSFLDRHTQIRIVPHAQLESVQ